MKNSIFKVFNFRREDKDASPRFFDLPSKSQKKVIKIAIRKANSDQKDTVSKYERICRQN